MPYADRISRFALCLSFFILLFPRAGWGAAEADRKGKGLEVAILCFSGRPEVRFVLDDEHEIQQLKDFLRNSEELDDFKGSGVVPATLGYRGVEIENHGGLPGFPRYMAAYRGTFEAIDGRHLFYRDRDRAIEKYIVELAYGRRLISKKVYTMLLEDISEK